MSGVQSSVDLARTTLAERAESLGLTASDIADTEVTDDYVSKHTGVRHVWLRQRIDGLPVALALTNVNIRIRWSHLEPEQPLYQARCRTRSTPFSDDFSN